jgi:hypothetical protein
LIIGFKISTVGMEEEKEFAKRVFPQACVRQVYIDPPNKIRKVSGSYNSINWRSVSKLPDSGFLSV